mgnify:CR=1 FL=1
MCGIAGIISSNNKNIDKNLLRKMTDLIDHRGPDDDGFHFEKGIGFGHRRLSIIDIKSGKQPMSDSDKSIWITYNGEIYNYKRLRKKLIAKGHRFNTNCDTEVIIYAYKEWGEKSFSYLNGMFAFALLDKQKDKTILVRDRRGVKPLYWSRIGDEILFSSEVKSILASPKFHNTANLNAISSYLTFRQAIWDITYFNGIEKLLPGHYLIIKNGQTNIKCYNQLPINMSTEDLGEDYYLNEVTRMLESSVKNRMMSDVPLGAYLSGGLDSSLLVALMAKNSNSKVKTFSIGYDQSEYNEEKFAEIVSQHCGTNHKQIKILKQDYLDNWIKLIRHKSAPLSIPHEVPLFKMSLELKKYITVVLSGEGADELFGGYGRVQRSPMDWKKIKFIKNIFGEKFSKLIADLSSHNSQLRNLNHKNHMSHFLSVYNWMPIEQKFDIFSDDVTNQLNNDEKILSIIENIFSDTKDINPYDRILHFFEKIHLDCLLDRLDMMSMAASVEARVPFVDDHDLVEFATNIPFKYKMVWNSKFDKLKSVFRSSANVSEVLDTNKYILRKVGSRFLPNSIAFRKKLGFPTPLDNWFKTGLIDYAKEILLDDRAVKRNLFNKVKMEKFLKLNEQLPYDFYGKKIWMLMNVELWFRDFID